ncbi:DUF4395 family protein [Micromonospora sp. NPDC048835]|uniref:DUF4395 family protein n=1 Tax=Micromonospora sp. NPDC048835 TaxID=3155147 RepID=UPI0033E4AC95
MTAAVLALGFGHHLAAYLVLGAVVVAATLESVFGFCVGCAIFAGLIRIGWIPDAVCAECSDIWSRAPANG